LGSFRFTPWEKSGSIAWIANTGISRSIRTNAQFDLRIGKRMTDCGPDWFWGVGMAFRQPDWRAFRGILP